MGLAFKENGPNVPVRNTRGVDIVSDLASYNARSEKSSRAGLKSVITSSRKCSPARKYSSSAMKRA